MKMRMRKMFVYGALMIMMFSALSGFSTTGYKVHFQSGNLPVQFNESGAMAFHSKQELKSYSASLVKKYKNQLGDKSLGKKLEARKEYKRFVERYNDKFFTETSLVMAILEKAPSCAKFSVKSLDVKGETLVVKLGKQCNNPDGEKVNWVMVLEVEKQQFNFKDVKVVVS